MKKSFRATPSGVDEVPRNRADVQRGPSTALGMTRVVALALTMVVLAACETIDKRHHVIVSVHDQRLALLDQNNLVATYPVSTSKFAIGDRPGSEGTPLGELEVAQKIGSGLPIGAVLKDRRWTGEILAPDAPGRDPIVTRILWLRGKEPQNANAFSRYIYIHGTAEERNIGRRASYGCVRMRSRDVVQLFDLVGKGAEVTITDQPLSTYVPGVASDEPPVPTKTAKAGMVIR